MHCDISLLPQLSDTSLVINNIFIQKQVSLPILDSIYKIAMILIAAFNIAFALYIFKVKNKKDNDSEEKNRRIGFLKTLVLDHSMIDLYRFFSLIDIETLRLKSKLSKLEKKEVNDAIIAFGIELRQRFIDPLIAIDNGLYSNVLHAVDELIDGITNCIYDEGINLTHKPKFEEQINQKIQKTKTSIISTLFSYKG